MAVFDDAVFLWNPNHGGVAYDQVSKIFGNFFGVGGDSIGAGSEVTTSGHPGRLFNGAQGSRFRSPIASIVPPQPWSLFKVVRLAAASRQVHSAFGSQSVANQWGRITANNAAVGEMSLRLNNAAAGANYLLVNPASLSGDTGLHVYATTVGVSGSDATLTGYVDSSTAFDSDTQTPSLTGAVDWLTIGRLEDSSETDSVSGEVYAAAAWDRELSSAEIAEILSNPYAYLDTDPAHPLVRGYGTQPSTVATTTWTSTIPAATQTGDEVLVWVVSRDHTAGTALATCTDNDAGGNTYTLKYVSTDRKVMLFRKVATSGTAGKTVTIAGAVGSSTGGITVWYNQKTGDPIDQVSFGSTDGSHTGFTPVANSAVCLATACISDDLPLVAGVSAATLGPMSLKQWGGQSTGGGDCSAAMFSRISPTATATGDFSWTPGTVTTYSISFEVLAEEVAPPDPAPAASGRGRTRSPRYGLARVSRR